MAGALIGTVAATIASVGAADTEPLTRGHVFYATGFDGNEGINGWTDAGRHQAGPQGKGVLEVAVAETATSVVSIPLPAAAMRGYLVRGTVLVRGEKVGSPPHPWNGIKCMMAIEAPDRKLWPQAEIGSGTFDWRRVGFTVRVPTNAESAKLVLGLESVSGKVWFDDVKITVARAPVRHPAKPAVGTTVYTGRQVPRFRGAMISPDIDAAGLRVLGRDWGANLIRWQLIRHGRVGQPVSDEGYDDWLEAQLKKLDAALPHCRDHGLNVVVDLHSPPGGKATAGGYIGSDDRLFTDPECQKKLVRVWEHIATRYRGVSPIWGYDLVNEPVEDFIDDGCDDWQALAERVARAIRAIDPVRTIIVEPSAWGGPSGLADLSPLPVSNVVYSVHMYLPHAFTHQGVHSAGPAYRYPGVIEGKRWDKSELEAALQPVVDFQRAYNVPIYIGEFSAIRWAPEGSAARYLSDLIDIFEARGWDWSYHAFREWSGWSLEHSDQREDEKPTAQPTERLRILQRAWSRNRSAGP